MKQLRLIFSISGAALAASASRGWACAVCLTGANDSTAEGFNASVLFLMATPYVVVGVIAGALVFGYRRSLRRRAEADATDGAEAALKLNWKQEERTR